MSRLTDKNNEQQAKKVPEHTPFAEPRKKASAPVKAKRGRFGCGAGVMLVAIAGFALGVWADGRTVPSPNNRWHGRYPGYLSQRQIDFIEGRAKPGDLRIEPVSTPETFGAPDGWREAPAIPEARKSPPAASVVTPSKKATRQEFLFTALRWDFREAQIMVQGYLDGNPAASDADAYKHCLQHARAGRHWNQSEVPSNLADALDADPTRAPDGSRARRLQEALGKDSEAAVWCARAILHLHPGLDLGLVYETSVQLAQEVRNWTARGAKDMRLTDLVACIQRESDWDPSCATLGHDGVWYRGLIQCPSGELGEGLAEIGGNLCHWGRERSYASYCGGPGNPQWWYSSQVLGLGAGIEKALRAEDAAARKKAEKGSA